MPKYAVNVTTTYFVEAENKEQAEEIYCEDINPDWSPDEEALTIEEM